MSIIKIDMNSPEFQVELEKTVKFTDKVIKQFNWVYNPHVEINEGVQMGLTRNKMMYNKRFCPCYMVEEVDGVYKSSDNRMCPCTPAIEKEIPEEGVCHCQIFCTPKYAASLIKSEEIEAVVHQHSRGLSAQECEFLLQKNSVDSDELTSLFEARELGMVNFKVVDVREWMEWKSGRIEGVDALIPTSSFFQTLTEAKLSMDDHIIVYCHVGSRSAHCQRILSDMGYLKVANLQGGIVSYGGTIARG
jgi:ferredoxin-thioredoxin reductase catalytic subunit/rhodanese-related sulfurtransferase